MLFYKEENDKQNIYEQFFDYYSGKSLFELKSFYIYKNPVRDEVKFIAEGSRGWVSPKGDLYLEGYEERNTESSVIHEEFIIALAKKIPLLKGGITKYENFSYNCESYGLLVQRIDNTSIIGLSESIPQREYVPSVVASILNTAQSKNKNFRFIPKNSILIHN
jgi:hypothetical protein